MTEAEIQSEFRERLGSSISLVSGGLNRFRVETPFVFDDGDHFPIFLRREGPEWVLSDEGATFMRLSYFIDSKSRREGNRARVIDSALSIYEVEDRAGELVCKVPDRRFGDALFSFVQALHRISDVSLWTREKVQSTFLHDVEGFLEKVIPAERRVFQWHDPKLDPEGHYLIDCRVNRMKTPVFIFTVPNDTHANVATVTMLRYEGWGVPFRSIGIFENQELIGRSVLARFSDAVGKQFSSLAGNEDKIAGFLRDQMVTGSIM
jgi:hypothetical protein